MTVQNDVQREESRGGGGVLLAARFKGAIWGQFVGDAACLGSHWIYDLAELERRFFGGVAGFETPAAGHYHAGKNSGDLTHYGDAALLLLRSVAELGRFSAEDFGNRLVTLFSTDEYGGYIDHATRGTLENYRAFGAEHPGEAYTFQGGADDDQPATATRLTPVVVAHFRDDALLQVVEVATRVCQNNARAIAYMKCHGLILRELFNGVGLRAAFDAAAQAISREPGYGAEVGGAIAAAYAARDIDVQEATLNFGQSCPLVSSFPAAVHCALRHEEDFVRAIVGTANAGGDSAGRAALIGSWLGALHGLDGIPLSWRERLTSHAEIAALIERLVAAAAPGQES